MNDTPTPETDENTLRVYTITTGGEFFAVHVHVSKRLEGERDEWINKASQYAAERESNAMQAMAYKSERDAALDALRKWDAVCVAADACNAEMESDEYSQTQWEAFEQKHTDLLESANRARLAVLFPANSHAHPPDMTGDATLNQPKP